MKGVLVEPRLKARARLKENIYLQGQGLSLSKHKPCYNLERFQDKTY